MFLAEGVAISDCDGNRVRGGYRNLVAQMLNIPEDRSPAMGVKVLGGRLGLWYRSAEEDWSVDNFEDQNRADISPRGISRV